jgi:hypothetical protein
MRIFRVGYDLVLSRIRELATVCNHFCRQRTTEFSPPRIAGERQFAGVAEQGRGQLLSPNGAAPRPFRIESAKHEPARVMAKSRHTGPQSEEETQ